MPCHTMPCHSMFGSCFYAAQAEWAGLAFSCSVELSVLSQINDYCYYYSLRSTTYLQPASRFPLPFRFPFSVNSPVLVEK